jgi:formylglycine-generating enzyme required for sulfatase activity
MKRLIAFILQTFCVIVMQAQNLAVQSFRMDETDLTANTAGTTVIDQNGNKCALIKVETTLRGFTFDAGTLGVVKTENHVGEVWVYVPEGVKRLSIFHEDYMPIRDYDLGMMLRRARTYVLRLSASQQQAAEETPTSQFVIFQVSPANATIELNGEILPVHNGSATKMMPFGSYDYRVQAPDYMPQAGKVVVDDPKQPHVVSALLRREGEDRLVTVGSVTFTMIPVKGGTFQMGATKEQTGEARKDEKPVHTVTLDNFQIGETEVSQALWREVMGSNPSTYKGNDLPVTNVTWEDCQEFIKKLNERTGKQFRLPTEAEWEFAARGGTASKGYMFSGSDEVRSVAWHNRDSNRDRHNGPYAIKSKDPNELGIYDMSGNVNEWCQDWFGDYTADPQTNPQGPATGKEHVYRGGSWWYYGMSCRVSRRNSGVKDVRGVIGLRLAMSK